MRNIKIVRVQKAEAVAQNIDKKNKNNLQTSSFGNINLPPVWGKVTKIAGINHVNIELSTGMLLNYVPVMSKRWVAKKISGGASGRKDIPEVGSKVLVIFPEGIIENALVFGSGFDSTQDWQKSVLLKEGEEHLDIEVDEYGNVFTRNKNTGEISIVTPDGNNITLNSSGFSITDSNGNTFESAINSIKINGTSLEVFQ